MKKIKISNGQPLETQSIENSNVAILTMYSDNGFLNAEVNPDIKVNDSTHTAIVDFMINERIQYTIDSIRIQGLDDIKPYVVQRELKFRSGQVVSYSRLLTSQQNLYLTGLFQSVYIQPKPASNGDSTQKDILIELKEIIPGNFTASVGYGTIEKLKGRLEVANINFRGTAQQIGAVVGASFINRDLQGSFREPWTFGTRWGTSVTAQWQYLSQPGYQAHTVGGNVSIGRKFMKISHASLTYQLERASLNNVSTTEIPLDLTNNISSLTLGLVYDSRDDLFNPTRGLYAQFSNEFAGYFLSGSVAFFRTLGELKYFYLLRRNTVLATAISGGRIDPSQGFNSLPLNERFYTGGPNTLRGYDYQKAGPLDKNGVPIGGEMMLVWHLFEIRQGIYKMFGGVLFMDLGNVWERPRNFTIRDIRYDAGIGLRVNTPIGLVRLDYAFKINRRSGQSLGNLYFGMGQAF
ncbi:MAG: BamA/TamA family outer membrane protein [Calditrichia bacterium]